MRCPLRHATRARPHCSVYTRAGFPDGLFSNHKVQTWVNFGGYCNGSFWYIFSVLVFCTKKNLATLPPSWKGIPWKRCYKRKMRPFSAPLRVNSDWSHRTRRRLDINWQGGIVATRVFSRAISDSTQVDKWLDINCHGGIVATRVFSRAISDSTEVYLLNESVSGIHNLRTKLRILIQFYG
jgi:hypothetical protein